MGVVHVVLQLVLYILSVIVAFAVAIPLGVVQAQYGNRCILYASVDWDKTEYLTTNRHVCNFSIYVQVFAGIVFPALFIIYHAHYLRKRNDPETWASMYVIPFVLFNGIAAVMIFVSSCVISVGFKVFCDNFASPPKRFLTRSCEMGQYLNWTVNDSSKHVFYYKWLVVAQIAGWTSLLVWCLQVGVGIHRIIRNRKPAYDRKELTDVAST